VASLSLGDRTEVVTADVAAVAEQAPRAFDVVTARSFADLATTARSIDKLLAAGGVGLVSEPPTDRAEAWTSALASLPELVDDGVYQGIRRLIRP
jgi:16S rRNA G527 N7-methylase RsmG